MVMGKITNVVFPAPACLDTRRWAAVDTSCQDAMMKLRARLAWLPSRFAFASEICISLISRSLQTSPLKIPPERAPSSPVDVVNPRWHARNRPAWVCRGGRDTAVTSPIKHRRRRRPSRHSFHSAIQAWKTDGERGLVWRRRDSLLFGLNAAKASNKMLF